MRLCADGAAGERHGGGPLRRPVRAAQRGFQTQRQSAPRLRRRDLRGAYPQLGVPSRIHAGREKSLERPAS